MTIRFRWFLGLALVLTLSAQLEAQSPDKSKEELLAQRDEIRARIVDLDSQLADAKAELKQVLAKLEAVSVPEPLSVVPFPGSGLYAKPDSGAERLYTFKQGDRFRVEKVVGSFAAGEVQGTNPAPIEGYAVISFLRKNDALRDLIVEASQEHESQIADEEVARAESPLSIDHFGAGPPNSADGVGVGIRFRYDGSKQIKYAKFYATAYNRVGDEAPGRHQGSADALLSLTGPIRARQAPRYSSWDAVWYNPTISCVELKRVELEYLDGSSYVYVRELPRILSPDFDNDCSIEAQEQTQ